MWSSFSIIKQRDRPKSLLGRPLFVSLLLAGITIFVVVIIKNQKDMKLIAIMVFMFLTFTVGTKAQENREAFTAEGTVPSAYENSHHSIFR